jgi:hypothetical protein
MYFELRPRCSARAWSPFSERELRGFFEGNFSADELRHDVARVFGVMPSIVDHDSGGPFVEDFFDNVNEDAEGAFGKESSCGDSRVE